ncbi:FecR family protein [Rhizobium subbaraonis]|uniref:FecR family protein n=1 Tax=Rhizobium subbaraonis TaxID=908946 RepID=A0A285V1T4_9HYPH|nr:FecR family protein [Rhizobium subbaraonis]SOC48125.1 FecR family protein [Rhizobium subbaraonis]
MAAKGAISAQKKRNREAADWLLRNSDPNQPPADKTRFREWLERDPENCRTYTAAENLMGDARRAIQSDPVLANTQVKPRSAIKPITAILVVAAVATGVFLGLDGPMRLEADVIAGADEMPVLTLADGSEVQLNASSAIAVDFTDDRRTIHLLRGQAFFQVAHAPERPFTVLAGTASVTALGTAFDVRYGEDDTEVTVTENAVRIELDGDPASILNVQQGEQATYDHARKGAVVTPVESLVALAWRRGQIAVDNAPLSDIVGEMNRHFRGRIVIAGSALANRRVSGTIKVADTDAALDFLTKVLGLKAVRLGPLIVIRS